MDCAAAVSANSDNPVRLYKNNTDFRGHSYGCHENYLLPRSLEWETLAAGVQAFLVTRQVFGGAGKYGWEDEDRFLQPGFQIAQRSDFFTELQSVDTMQRRPLVNTRDEPHADPARFRRFHVIIGDANLSPYATYLKVGSTALVLEALAAGAPLERFPRLADRDRGWKWEVTLAGGRRATALSVQHQYLEIVRDYVPGAGNLDSALPWPALFARWNGILHDLERDPLSTADRLDWSAKHQLIEGFRATEGLGEDDPWLRSLDLSYHELNEAEGLYFGLRDAGSFVHPCPEILDGPEGLRAPATTRAALRGGCIEKFGPMVLAAQWDGVVMRTQAKGHRRVELDLRGVFAPEQVSAGLAALGIAQAPEDLLTLPFARLV
jgi:proteasome accessory factor A